MPRVGADNEILLAVRQQTKQLKELVKQPEDQDRAILALRLYLRQKGEEDRAARLQTPRVESECAAEARQPLPQAEAHGWTPPFDLNSVALGRWARHWARASAESRARVLLVASLSFRCSINNNI